MQSVCDGLPAVVCMKPLIHLNQMMILYILNTGFHVWASKPAECCPEHYIWSLWLIAYSIARSVCHLGGFHTLMSFLGLIGHMMAGSGIEECMCWAEKHMLSSGIFLFSLHVCKLLSFILPVENMQLHTSVEPVSQEAMVQILSVSECISSDKISADWLQCVAVHSSPGGGTSATLS